MTWATFGHVVFGWAMGVASMGLAILIALRFQPPHPRRPK